MIVESFPGDEAELAKKIAALKWHGKEMEVGVYNNVQDVSYCAVRMCTT